MTFDELIKTMVHSNGNFESQVHWNGENGPEATISFWFPHSAVDEKSQTWEFIRKMKATMCHRKINKVRPIGLCDLFGQSSIPNVFCTLLLVGTWNHERRVRPATMKLSTTQTSRVLQAIRFFHAKITVRHWLFPLETECKHTWSHAHKAKCA